MRVKSLPIKEFKMKYDEVFSYSNIEKAYHDCCLSVGWKPSIQRYKNHRITLLTSLYNRLKKRKFKSKGFYAFDIFERGKLRHIKSVNIEERIVQRCLCDNCLVPLIVPKLIYDNSACLTGKGYDFAISRIRRHITTFYRKNGLNGWILQFDIHHYFESIPHDKMIDLMSKIIDDKDILKLYCDLVNNFPGDVGLGLGSQISQISAVYYLNSLDHFIKDKLGVKYYARYMDDGYVIAGNKDELYFILDNIKIILKDLGLELNNKTRITKLSKNFTFLKAKFLVLSNGKIIMKPSRGNITKERRKIKKLGNKLVEGTISSEDINASVQSWKGHLLRFDSHNTIESMDKLYEEVLENAYTRISSGVKRSK